MTEQFCHGTVTFYDYFQGMFPWKKKNPKQTNKQTEQTNVLIELNINFTIHIYARYLCHFW